MVTPTFARAWLKTENPVFIRKNKQTSPAVSKQFRVKITAGLREDLTFFSARRPLLPGYSKVDIDWMHEVTTDQSYASLLINNITCGILLARLIFRDTLCPFMKFTTSYQTRSITTFMTRTVIDHVSGSGCSCRCHAAESCSAGLKCFI